MNKSTIQRGLLGLAVLMMLVPTFLFAAGPLRKPPLFDGDKLVKMRCQPCEGLGQVKGEECNSCRGQGQVDMIVAGPHRPVQLVGTVKLGQETVERAEISIGYSDGTLSFKTNHNGQFGAKLPPGKYSIKVDHDGRSAQKDLEVKQDSEPIPVGDGSSLRRLEVDFQL